MSSTGDSLEILEIVNNLIDNAPVLNFDQGILEVWGTEVSRILKTLGLCHDGLRPIELLLILRDDNPISHLKSKFFSIDTGGGDEIVNCVVARYVICSTISEEIEDMLAGNFPTFDSANNIGQFPKGWYRQLHVLYHEHVSNQATALRKAAEKAEEAAKRMKEFRSAKRRLATHKREGAKLEEVLETLKSQMNDSDIMAEEDSGMEDDGEEDSLMGKDEMDDSNTEGSV